MICRIPANWLRLFVCTVFLYFIIILNFLNISTFYSKVNLGSNCGFRHLMAKTDWLHLFERYIINLHLLFGGLKVQVIRKCAGVIGSMFK